jgi:hypothetical protein
MPEDGRAGLPDDQVFHGKADFPDFTLPSNLSSIPLQYCHQYLSPPPPIPSEKETITAFLHIWFDRILVVLLSMIRLHVETSKEKFTRNTNIVFCTSRQVTFVVFV